MKFNHIVVLGGGLLGGSLVLRAQESMSARLWVRRAEAVAEAKAIGIYEVTDDLHAALDGADLVMLAVPVGAMPELVKRVHEAGISEQALVSDVGSVKASVHAAMRDGFEDKPLRFIGGHPMAGSEAQGLAAARIDLFDQAACLLTDEECVGEPWTNALEEFWRQIGCRTHWLSAADHDQLVARISHVPHVMAAVTALIGFRDPADGAFAGGGIRDTTRVAAGDPEMWAEILLENREAIVEAIGPAQQLLTEILGLLEGADYAGMRDWLAEARRLQADGLQANHSSIFPNR